MPETDFFQLASSLARETGSYYTNNKTDRRRLREFMDGNGWFGIEKPPSSPQRKTPYLSGEEISVLEPRLRLWMSAYRRSNREKLYILANHGKTLFPWTTQRYVAFIRLEHLENESSAWQLLDYLLASLKVELKDCMAEDTENLAACMDKELPLVTARLFSRFLEHIGRDGYGSGWSYRFSGRTPPDTVNHEAYTVVEFSEMAYCTFNAEAWEENHLVEKACDSSVYANLWAYIAMHFVCALRGTDLTRLPLFSLPCGGEMLRKQIMTGSYSGYARFSRELMFRLQYKSLKPQKTLGQSNVPELKLFIPQSLEEPLGLILAIAASYYPQEKIGCGFLKPSKRFHHIRDFFGPAFASVLGGKDFSTRKANKSYLQGISSIAGVDGPKGYMLAALARSHKGGIGTLPDITELYLRDSKFSGCSPEFIAREIFERGVLGFIPYLLLESCFGDEFTNLSIRGQTEMIKLLGISPSGVEGLITMNEKAISSAKTVLAEVLPNQRNIPNALHRLAAGCAAGKQDGFLCLMTAAGFSCCCPERSGCFGCRYEIYTKAAFHVAVKEYVRLRSLMARKKDEWRCRAILRTVVLPAITEMLESLKLLYPGTDMDALTQIMEGGLAGYVGSGQSGE